MITLTYKGDEIKISKANLVILGDLTFSAIVFIWYLIYKLGFLRDFSPLLALIITFIQNIIIFLIMVFKKQTSKEKIIQYLIVTILLKILPIISFYPDNFIITFKDIVLIIYLYIIYMIIIFILIGFFRYKYDIKTVIYDDISGKGYEHSIQYNISSLSYESITDAIFSYTNTLSNNTQK